MPLDLSAPQFASIAELEREALACTRCALAEGRTQVVFGSGVELNGVLLPLVLALSVLVAFAGCAWPLTTALRFQPSVVLRES